MVFADLIGVHSDQTSYFIVSHDGKLHFQILGTSVSPPGSHISGRAFNRVDLYGTFIVTQSSLSLPQPLFLGSERLNVFHARYGRQVSWRDLVPNGYVVQQGWSIGVVQLMRARSGSYHATKIAVQYWCIVLPLTFASACLLLKKMKSTKSTGNSSGPASHEPL